MNKKKFITQSDEESSPPNCSSVTLLGVTNRFPSTRRSNKPRILNSGYSTMWDDSDDSSDDDDIRQVTPPQKNLQLIYIVPTGSPVFLRRKKQKPC